MLCALVRNFFSFDCYISMLHIILGDIFLDLCSWYLARLHVDLESPGFFSRLFLILGVFGGFFVTHFLGIVWRAILLQRTHGGSASLVGFNICRSNYVFVRSSNVVYFAPPSFFVISEFSWGRILVGTRADSSE